MPIYFIFNNWLQYFPVKWGGIALKNCDDKGELLNFKSKNEASKSVIRPWIYLPLKIFIIEEELYPVWCCPQCQEMKGIMSLQPAQSDMAIKRIQCIHSEALSHLIHDWRNLWNVVFSNRPSHQLDTSDMLEFVKILR